MSLLAPLGLLPLLLAPLIIAIHLWRIRHRRVELSSTLLWSQVLSQTPLRRPRYLPKRLLLLILELLALAFGALALARPAWVAAGAHRHLVVAVDTSLAMSATDVAPSRLARAKDEVRTLIDGLGQGDSMTLMDAGTIPRDVATSDDQAVLIRALDTLRQGYGPSSLVQDTPLLTGLIRSDLGAGSRRDAAYLFAPLGTERAVLDALGGISPLLHVRLVGSSTEDRGVAGLTVSCTQSSCEAFARLVNTGPRAVTTRLSALVDSAALHESVTLPANSDVPVGLTLPRGAHTVEVRLDGHDPLPLDDAAWAVVPLPVHRTALLVTGDDTTPLAQALRAIPNLTLDTTTPDAYTDAMTSRVDLTILDTTGADIQPPGNVFMVNPTSGAPLFDMNGVQTAPGIAEARPPGSPSGDGSTADGLLNDVDLSSLVVSSASRARLPAWAHADIDGDTGPLLFSGTTGGRRVAVLLFDPRTTATANASNLDTLLAFPTLLRNVVETLAPAPTTAAMAGTIVPVPLARQGAAWLQLAPSGSRSKVSTRALPSSGDLAALPALRPGLYDVGGVAGGGAQPIAVNAAVPGDPAASAAPAPAAAPSGPNVLAPSLLTPWEGWAILALLALLALSGEWWYYIRHT